MTSKQSEFNDYFMLMALEEAKKAAAIEEIPVGCVLVDRSSKEVVTIAHNMCEHGKNANLHAEIIAIYEACRILDSKNLSALDMYVSLEPCTMCASAISNARIGRLYYGASDEKQGAVENGVRFFTAETCLHRPEIYSGIKSEESRELMQNFFMKLRL
jgi:cytosine deaminase